jgi:hypothetical protein
VLRRMFLFGLMREGQENGENYVMRTSIITVIPRQSTIRSVDTPTICKNTQSIIVPRIIDDSQYACALAMFTSTVTSASHSGSVVVQLMCSF